MSSLKKGLTLLKNSSFFKNIFLVMFSNISLMFLGIVMSFALPLFLSVENYGYWQIFLYYTSYLGMFLFGFNDGMNLRFAGIAIHKLDRKLFKSFFYFVVVFTIGLSAFLFFLLSNVNTNNNLFFIYFMLIINIVIFNINGFCIHINQMTKNFKIYSALNILERLLFVLFIPLLIWQSIDNFKILLLLNTFCRLVTMSINLYTIRQLVFCNHKNIKLFDSSSKKEIIKNFVSGFPLTMGSIFSTFISTIPRFIVEKNFTVTTYGIFSFSYSTLNLVIQIISAMSTVFYPSIRLLDLNKQKKLFVNIKNIIILFSYLGLLSYFFVVFMIKYFYPNYIDSLKYLHFIFPLLIYQTFNSIVTSVYFKVLRKERLYLINNFIFLTANLMGGYLAFYLFKEIKSIVLTAIFINYIWCVVSDYVISKDLQIGIKSDLLIYSPIIVTIFVLSNEYLTIWISLIIYLCITLTIVYINLKKFISMYELVKSR
ncbi:oligosaccharide flippase family protein [Streptococcus sp. ZJ151]|uniref:lipopolysaccharide biosynthesis protein n=1 Tax=Streptococcus jiangjianxini TaxID=3161189 RepID=UPI0032EEFF12